MKRLVLVCAAIALLMFATTSDAWEGSDSETGGTVEIGTGNLVREGETIEVYDYDSGEYRDVDVESIYDSGSSVEVEVYDSEAGEYRTFEMEN